MLPPAITISPAAARAFVRRAHRLDQPHADIDAALAHHAWIQMDPIHVCGRMHDLILRNRIAGYRENGLTDFLHAAPRPGFEHCLTVRGCRLLLALGWEAWPHLVAILHERREMGGGLYSGKLSAADELLAERLLGEISERGPLASEDIAHEGRSANWWGGEGRAVKTVLDKLLLHGRVLIAARRGFRRVYDLPGRVLPPEVATLPPAAPEATDRWKAHAHLRQRRLLTLRRDELPLVEDLVQPVKLAGLPGSAVFILREDVPLLEAIDVPTGPPLLLAPLDPIIYDRALTRRLWDFDYTWEVYTPSAKRARGYYALPILAGTELVGHADLKADRGARRLRVVGRSVRRGFSSSTAVHDLARFLGLR